MKIKLSFVLLSLSVLNFATGYPQKTIALSKVLKTKGGISVELPFELDSTNMKGEKFVDKNLLSTSITLPKQMQFTEEVKADVTYDYFFLPKAQSKPNFQFLYFQLSTTSFAKVKLKVTSAGMFELYDNSGKAQIIKSTVEDSLKQAQMMTKELDLTPGTTDFIIKYMSLPSNKAPEGVKIAIETDNASHIKVTYDGKKLITIQDIIAGVRLLDTQISPDGQFLLLNYKARNSEGKTNNYSELLNVKTNRKTLLGNKVLGWFPKSNKLYYTEKRLDKLMLISINPENLTEQIASENIPEGSFNFTPDEKALIFIVTEEDKDSKKGDLIRLKAPDDRQDNYSTRYFISKFDLNTGLNQRLTFGKVSTNLNDISHDSRYILFSTRKETITESPFSTMSMFRLDMQTMQVDTLWLDDPYTSSAQFSPDDKQILIEGSAKAFGGIGLILSDANAVSNNYNTQLFVMDIASKKVDAIGKDFSPSVKRANWNPVDNMIYLNVVDTDKETVYRYSPKNQKYELLNLSEDVVNDFSSASVAYQAAYSGSGPYNPKRGYLFDLRSLKSTLIADPNKEEVSQLNLGKMEDWNFTASDGTTIMGRYYLPPNFDAAKKYPMIVYYYGGTTPVPRTFDYPYPMQVYAALGYVVYVVQPSGAIGFGQDFAARHVNAWGKRTAEDIIEGTKLFLEKHPYVDASKVGCIGASYGGFMTMYLQTQTDMFAAAVSHAGISSLSSYWGEGFWGYTYSSAASAGSYPWNNREMYIEQSPLFNADKMKTPLLLLHGTADTNVPIGESIQMYTALKILGCPVEFIQVKNENHGIRDYNKQIQWNYSIYAWFAKWLQNDTAWWNTLYPDK